MSIDNSSPDSSPDSGPDNTAQPERGESVAPQQGGGAVRKTEEQWRQELNPAEYSVLRQAGTERAFTGAYVHETADGAYHCRACDAVLFDAGSKYDSGTGWPSFTEPAVAEAVDLVEDNGLFMRRTEVRCRRCGSHLGHVFDDGPGPSGQRYCMNSVALALHPRD